MCAVRRITISVSFLLIVLSILFEPISGSAQSREVRIVNTTAIAGQMATVSIELVAQGNENAIGFSLNFNPTVLSNPVVTLGSGASGATLNANTVSAQTGRIGIAIAMPTGGTFTAGVRQIVSINFTVAANSPAGAATLIFGDQPVVREIADANANTLTTTFTNGAITVSLANPVPSLTSLSPNSAVTGGAGFTLTVDGANFINGSVVRWNNSDRATTFVSTSRLTAQIPASDLVTTPGTAIVTVFNPAPGGGASNILTFTIVQANPAPTVRGVSPAFAIAGGGAFTLTVTGVNFINGSVVRWKDADRPTTFVSSTQLQAAITAADIAGAGPASVKVFTPTPGGGNSNAVTFNVYNSVANVSAASYLGDSVAPESIIAAFGVNLATGTELATTQPLPTTLLGTTVKVKDSAGVERDAPLFFVAPTQVNYLIPAGTAEGAATVTAISNSNIAGLSQIPVTKVAPGLISANSSGQGVAAAVVLRVSGGAQTYEPVSTFDSAQSKFIPRAIDLGPNTDEVFLVLYGTGFRGNSGVANVKLTIGGVNTPVLFAGAAPDFTGLDQCNAGPIPRSLAGRGIVDVILTVDNKIANTVQVSIK